jgi:transposase InsO family protein
MADVARDLRSEFGAIATVRHIQRILSTELIDTERMDARGGPLASVSYRSKLLREVAYPNQWWIGDHTFVNFEHLDPEHPQLSRGLTDFDLQFEVAVESRRRQGVLRRNRSGICITRWMDACTRLTVGVTIWLTPPNAIQTLASLFPACLRYGIPEGIYTDNGSDFRSNAVQGAVVNVGMRHAFSRPATPEGRGKLERSFQTLKRVLARWPGSLCGRHPVRWATEQPLTPAQLQNAIVQHVALEERTVPNRSTGLPPAIHFERAVGARGLSGTSPEAIARLLTLLPCEVRQRQIFGVEVGNLPYWCPALKTVPIGSRLFVHSIPNEYEYRYLSAPAADGSLRYIGRAPVYDVDHPPPDLAEAAALEAAFDAHIAGVAERAILAGDQAIRLDAADVEGEVIAAAMPHAPLAAASVLASPSMRSLPAPSRGSEAKKLPSKANETEIPDPFA